MGISASIHADASAGIRANGRREMRRPRRTCPFHATVGILRFLLSWLFPLFADSFDFTILLG